MMIPKRNLRKRVVLGEKTNQNLESKKSVTNKKDQKKKYNLRKSDKIELKLEKPCMLKNVADVSNLQIKNCDINKENRVKLRGKREVIKLDHSSKIENIENINKVSNCEIVVKRNDKSQKFFKSTVIPCKAVKLPIWRKNLPNPERILTQKQNFDIYDISQDEDMSHIVRGISKKVKKISKKTGKSVKRFLNKSVSKKGLKSTQKKTNPNPNQCITTKSDKPNSNPSCSVHTQVKSSEVPLQTDEKLTDKPCFNVENYKKLNCPEPSDATKICNLEPSDATEIYNVETFDATEIYNLEPLNLEKAPPKLTCQDTSTILLNVADDFEKSLLHPRMTSTPDTAAMATVPPKNNNYILNNISHIASNKRNIVQVVIDTPDSLPAENFSKRGIDVTLFKLPEPKRKNPAVLKYPQKPVPKMTSTPYTAAMATIPSNNNILNDISHIPSKNRDIVKVVIDTPDPLPPKKTTKRGADVTLFESPEPKKKNPPKMKSPQKSVQMNLIEHFLSSPEKSLEESVKKPFKAYHTPDNFKTHLARTKRASEVMRIEKKKSKEDLMIEQMAKHFEEVSGIELCIE